MEEQKNKMELNDNDLQNVDGGIFFLNSNEAIEFTWYVWIKALIEHGGIDPKTLESVGKKVYENMHKKGAKKEFREFIKKFKTDCL